jgi:YidC/Oxa1 family membrane protein insertase
VSDIWNSILDVFQGALSALHDVFVPLAGDHAWGWAIIALTLIIRLLLLPLAIKQIRSMRAMQAIQPQMKELQKKYKVDRDLMKKDPEQYRAKKQKLNEEMMALYQREGVNPAASCLPLLAQAPVFFALFSILRGGRAAELANQPFYFLTSYITDDAEFTGLGALVSQAFWPGWLLVVLMAATMFISQKQTMARQPMAGGDNPMAQQQKILLYVMPVFLAVISFNLPLGVLLYWVTTNAWQAGQQWFMLREVQHEVDEGTLGDHPGGEAARAKPGKKGKGPTKGGKKGPAANEANGSAPDPGQRSPGATSGKGGATSGKDGAVSDRKASPGDGGSASSKTPPSKAGGKSGGKRGGGSSGKGGRPAASGGPSTNGKPKDPKGPSGRKPPKRDHLPRRIDRD